MISYLSVPGPTNGTGLFSIDKNMVLTRIASHSSVYANRLLKPNLNCIVIGPYIIDAAGGVRTIEALLTVRIGGMSEHLTDPNKVYMLGMDGPFWQVDLVTLEVQQLFDLTEALGIPAGEQVRALLRARRALMGGAGLQTRRGPPFSAYLLPAPLAASLQGRPHKRRAHVRGHQHVRAGG